MAGHRGETTVALVDPDDELVRVKRALAEDDDVATVVAETAAAIDADPDCAVVLDGESVDGREQLASALDALDAPVVVFAVEPDGSFMGEVQSMGAADIIRSPADDPESVVRPDVIARRIKHAAGVFDPFASDGELLDALLTGLPHEVFIKNEYGRFEDVSLSKAREYDMRREQVIGLTDFELMTDIAAELTEEEREIMETGEPLVNSVEHYVDEEGRDRWVSVTKSPRSEQSVGGVVGAVRDVTEQKRQEEILNALHAASRDLLSAETPQQIAEVTAEVAKDVPDLPVVEVALSEDDGLVPVAVGGDAESPFERHEAAFRECYESAEATAVGPDGATSPLDAMAPDEAVALALPLGDHGVLGVTATEGEFGGFGIDLAEVLAANVEAVLDQVTQEQALARQNERLEEFASIVSHDLRNPLSVAQGYLDMLDTEERDASPEASVADERSPSTPDSQAGRTTDDVVDEVKWALDRIERLTDDLLTLAQSGEVVGETSVQTLEQVAFEAWRDVETEAAILTVEGALGSLEADRERLLELFENLFRNAVEHGAQPGSGRFAPGDAGGNGSTSPASHAQQDAEEHSSASPASHAQQDAEEHSSASPASHAQQDAVEHAHDPVTVTVGTLDGDRRGFYVADDGPGIPDDRKERVFERGHTTADDGTGLGLHIVETLADAHGWSVRVVDGERGGARFEITTAPSE
jgi:PAS domain S-box-containing protein